ncbi:MAG: hypothetical protein COW22_01095 [Chloroflexi bacterium CG15_BIG_FIL_POST_REV_8_21_14_020_46_15]|nr:MAG: hypothetical protein COW22_01095 [Chloroflexi bacterium CG15_BIG_FIL_POST_REV_8_21_14_020_46_15]
MDPEELNPRLTEWLIEYNFNRPHQSPGYLAPMEYILKENLLKFAAQCYHVVTQHTWLFLLYHHKRA